MQLPQRWTPGYGAPGPCVSSPWPCNPLNPDAMKVIVRSPIASPYAYRWILANDRRLALGDSVDFVAEPQTIAQTLNGAQIATGTDHVTANQPYGKVHHVSIAVDGELLDPIGSEIRQPPEVSALGNRSSLLKARITLGMGNARIRKFDFDIGAGVEFDVKAYKIKNIEVLIPDPRVPILNAELLVPPPSQPEGQLSTLLTTTTYFTTIATGQHNPLTYTVPLILAGEEQASWMVPRVADSVAVTGGVNAFDDAASGGVIVDFIYVTGGLREVVFGPPFPNFSILDQVALPAGSSRLPHTLIPGNANAFLVRRTFETASTLVNVVQVLNL